MAAPAKRARTEPVTEATAEEPAGAAEPPAKKAPPPAKPAAPAKRARAEVEEAGPAPPAAKKASGKKAAGAARPGLDHEGWAAIEEGRVSFLVGLGPYISEFE